jgi:hypothetical protein
MFATNTPSNESTKMKTLRYLSLSLTLLLTGFSSSFCQVVSSVPSEYTDPTTEVKILVNLDLLDQTQEYVLNLIADADAGLDLYIWTWKPYEFPAGHPKANGEGAQAWKNSNELLKMTQEAEHLYSYTMVPTEFYEVDAATVYAEDIHFLVKPKDGGGYGDPDRKSGDLLFVVDPPNVARPAVYGFPIKPLQDDVFRVVYDNYKEEKLSMQNLGTQECYVFLEATLTDSTIIRPSSIFQVGNNPDLQMKQIGTGIFELVMIPELFFNLQPGQKIDKLKAVVIRQIFISGADRVDNDFVVDMACWND